MSDTAWEYVRLNAGEDLRGKERSLLVVNDQGKVVLPTSAEDPVVFILLQGADVDEECMLIPMCSDRTPKVFCAGPVSAGDMVTLADAPDLGKIRRLPMTSGNYRCIGVALTPGTDEPVHIIPCYMGKMTVL